VSAGLANVGGDNLAWSLKIASDHRRKTGRHMKSYIVKFSDREEGPYAETQMAQMFADGRIDRNTTCKPADRGEWKSVDDYLPMLKYGTQLPPPAKAPAVPPAPPPILLSSQPVSVVDFDIPFGSVLKIMFKWMAAALVVFCCFLPVIFVLWLIVTAIFAALFSGAMSTFHHP
jgi:GYF domain 2